MAGMYWLAAGSAHLRASEWSRKQRFMSGGCLLQFPTGAAAAAGMGMFCGDTCFKFYYFYLFIYWDIKESCVCLCAPVGLLRFTHCFFGLFVFLDVVLHDPFPDSSAWVCMKSSILSTIRQLHLQKQCIFGPINNDSSTLLCPGSHHTDQKGKGSIHH